MTKKFILPVLLAGLSFTCIQVYAQNDKEEINKEKNTNIIIRKKGDTKEKITIVIDGDNVSINGKPVDEFSSKNVDIIQNSDKDLWNGEVAAMPYPPEMPQGFGRNFMRGISSNKAFLGVMTKPAKDGASITDVTEESPAEKAGLKEDDIITKIGDDKVTGPDDLYKAIGKCKPDDKVIITYKRNGKENTAAAILSSNEDARVFSWSGDGEGNMDGNKFSWNGQGENMDSNFIFTLPQMPPNGFAFSWNNKPRLGMQVQDTDDDSGVKVLNTEDESAAEKAGLKEHDIITSINNTDIKSTEDLRKIIKDAKPGDSFTVSYKRDGQVKTTTVKFPKELKTIDL